MEYKIDKISTKKHNVSEEESIVIKRAIPFYKNTLDRYEKMLLKFKEENDRQKEQPKTLDDINPFVVTNNEQNYIPTVDEIKTFVYSCWAKTVADVQTPYVSDGQRKKGIVKRSFRDVSKGKYINKNVRDIMSEYINRMTLGLNLNEKE